MSQQIMSSPAATIARVARDRPTRPITTAGDTPRANQHDFYSLFLGMMALQLLLAFGICVFAALYFVN